MRQVQTRIKLLKEQLYGKARDDKPLFTPNISLPMNPIPTKDTKDAYLKKDLLKVLMFSSLAVSFQLVLYFATNTYNLLR